MIILGLTGSIGMGKSASAAMFRDKGVPVYDADAAVHALYEAGGAAVAPLSERFDAIVQNGAIHRPALRAAVLDDPQAMADLEAIVHPLVGQSQRAFRSDALRLGAKFAVLDIPLLYETGGDANCDHVAVVTAPAALQRQRVLDRPGMTQATFEAILSKQMPDADKRARADFIISTAFGFEFADAHVTAICELINGWEQERP